MTNVSERAAFDAGFRMACSRSCGCMDGEYATSVDRDEALQSISTRRLDATDLFKALECGHVDYMTLHKIGEAARAATIRQSELYAEGGAMAVQDSWNASVGEAAVQVLFAALKGVL